MGRGGGDETGIAHDRLLIPLGRRIAPLLRTDDGRGGVARAGPFSTLGKGDYRGMGFFILFFSILFCFGGVRTSQRGRDVLLLGSRVFALGGCGVGVGSFVFHFRGFALGSDRSGGKIARGVLLVGEWGVEFRGLGFALGGRDFIFARRRQLLGEWGIPFGEWGVEFRGLGFALGGCDFIFARRRQFLGRFVFHFRGFGVEFRELGIPFGGFFLLGGGQGVVGRQAAVATVAQMREQHDVDADARSAHTAAQTAAVADAEGARIEREIGGEEGHKGRNVFLNV